MAEALHPRKLRAIVALMVHSRQSDAAKAADIPERTLRTWQTEPDFQAELARRGADMMRDANRVLQIGAVKAAQTLVDIADGKIEDSKERLRASVHVIELASKLTELCDLEGRLRALERSIPEAPAA